MMMLYFYSCHYGTRATFVLEIELIRRSYQEDYIHTCTKLMVGAGENK